MIDEIKLDRRVPVKWSGDVVIAGAGPAGIGAALSAARQGAKVLLLEQAGDVGGVATTGLMSHWTGKTRGGLYEEILNRADDSHGENRVLINPEKLKTVLLEMLLETGVSIRLYTFSHDAIAEDEVVKGVIGYSKAGFEAFKAKVVIDCTGDGDIAASAGVPFEKGRPGDGRMQPMTLMFKVAGVDMDRAVFLPSGFEETFEVPEGDLQSLGREHLPYPAGHVLLYRSTLPGVITCNMTNCVDVDGTDPDDLTRATVECRKQIEPIVGFLREYVPGFEDCYCISSASIIGVRETRHFDCRETLTEEDILQARVFDDWVVTKAHFNFDIHNVEGSGLDTHGVQKKFTQEKGYTIPYGCLVPVSRRGLLLAGRNISATHKASSNCRVMPICVNIGQAAGTAAALSVKKGVAPDELDVREIQKSLNDQGVTL